MSHSEVRKLNGLTVRIDRLICVGFGDCIEEAPEAFELDDEGIAVFLDGVDGMSREALVEACRSCPVDAIVLEDADGRQIAP